VDVFFSLLTSRGQILMASSSDLADSSAWMLYGIAKAVREGARPYEYHDEISLPDEDGRILLRDMMRCFDG